MHLNTRHGTLTQKKIQTRGSNLRKEKTKVNPAPENVCSSNPYTYECVVLTAYSECTGVFRPVVGVGKCVRFGVSSIGKSSDPANRHHYCAGTAELICEKGPICGKSDKKVKKM